MELPDRESSEKKEEGVSRQTQREEDMQAHR